MILVGCVLIWQGMQLTSGDYNGRPNGSSFKLNLKHQDNRVVENNPIEENQEEINLELESVSDLESEVNLKV